MRSKREADEERASASRLRAELSSSLDQRDKLQALCDKFQQLNKAIEGSQKAIVEAEHKARQDEASRIAEFVADVKSKLDSCSHLAKENEELLTAVATLKQQIEAGASELKLSKLECRLAEVRMITPLSAS